MVEEGVLSAVKRIVDVFTHTNGERYFRINWKDTWEPESNLISCEELLEKFWHEKVSDGVKPNLEKTTKPEDPIEDAVPIICSCGKIAKTNLKKKTYTDKTTQLNCNVPFKRHDVGMQVNSNLCKKKKSVSIQVGSQNITESTKIDSASVKKCDFGAQVNTYHHEQKNALVQTSSVKKYNFSVQVNTSYQKQRNASVQIGTGIFKTFDFGTQVNIHKKQKNVCIQVGSGIVKRSELAVQVNTLSVEKHDRSVQYSQTTTERGTQFLSSNHDKSSQYDKNISTHDCSVQTKTVYQDECNQFDDSLSEFDGSILQKEVSVQFSPSTIHCGIQTWVYRHDQFTQCSENIFQREIACQFTPRTISCGIQKDTLNVDKYCQYEEEFVIRTEHLNPKLDHKVGTNVFECSIAKGVDLGRTQHILHRNEKNISDHESSDKSFPANPHQLSDVPTTQAVLMNDAPTFSKLIPEQKLSLSSAGKPSPSDAIKAAGLDALKHRHVDTLKAAPVDTKKAASVDTVKAVPVDILKHTTVEKSDGKMREMLFVADAPLNLHCHGKNINDDQNHPNEVGVRTKTSDLGPYNVDTPNTPISIILTTSTGTSTLPQNLLFQPSSSLTSENSTMSSSIAVAKNLILQSNITSYIGQNILQSQSLQPSLSQPVLVQNGYSTEQNLIISSPQIRTITSLTQPVIGQFRNEYGQAAAAVTIISTPVSGTVPSFSQTLMTPLQTKFTNGHSTIVNTPQIANCVITKTITDVTPSVAMQLLEGNITSLGGTQLNTLGGGGNLNPLTYLSQQNIYTEPLTPENVPVNLVQKLADSSTVTNSECSQTTDAIALMYHYFKSPDQPKSGDDKKKKKKRTVKAKDVDCVEGKPKKRTKRKKSVEEQSTAGDFRCLPVYDIMPRTDMIKDEHDISTTVNCRSNDETKVVVSKFINQSDIPSSDANEINDDFISRYWK